MGRWILVVTLLFVAIILAFGIFVATGVIDGSALVWRFGNEIGWIRPHLQTYGHGQDAEAWIATQQEDLQQTISELERREIALATNQEELEQRSALLDRREADLDEQVANLQALQEQSRSAQTLAEIYTEMSAEEAARILQELDQDLILDILLHMDMLYAANILTELPTNLAVALSEKMGQTSQ